MTKLAALFFAMLLCFQINAQDADETAVRKILSDQTAYWNKGDLVNFMGGYWKSDSLMFIGSKGVTYGFENTLNNYKKNYGTPDKMGTLKFTLVKVQRLSADYYFVVGKWELTRKAGDVSGHYDLIFRKIDGKWVIISDHSS